jgi:hypothetical protein
MEKANGSYGVSRHCLFPSHPFEQSKEMHVQCMWCAFGAVMCTEECTLGFKCYVPMCTQMPI